MNGNAASESASPLQCPRCDMTAAELHTEGVMGCAECYRVFDAVVARAAAELHGVVAEEAPPLSPARIPLPWPTRRAETQPLSQDPPKQTRTDKRKRL